MFGLLLLGLVPLFGLNLWMHELGHFMVARLFGYHLYEVRLGNGYLLKRFYFLDCEWWIYSFPFGGYCDAQPTSEHFYRLKKGVFILGGPMMDVLLLCGIWYGTYPVLTYLGLSDQEASDGLALYMLTLGALTLFSWKPTYVTLYGRKLQSDSLSLWYLLKNRVIPRIPGEFYVLSKVPIRFYRLWKQGRKKDAARYFLKVRADRRVPEDPVFLTEMAAVFYQTSLFKKAGEFSLNAMSHEDIPPQCHVTAVAILVCVSLLENRRDQWGKGLDLLDPVILKYPDKISLKTAKGCVLAELERNTEAVFILKEVCEASKSQNDKAICFAYLAWIAARKKDVEGAREYLGQMPQLDEINRISERKVKQTEILLEGN